jgi:serine phosphatase RsbU (regulator of sigma subunit)
MASSSVPIGIYSNTKPVITELPLEPGTHLVVFTDGILEAGRQSDRRLDVATLVPELLAATPDDPQSLADALLERAVAADQGRPRDDISVLVVTVATRDDGDDVRRMAVSFPLH